MDQRCYVYWLESDQYMKIGITNDIESRIDYLNRDVSNVGLDITFKLHAFKEVDSRLEANTLEVVLIQECGNKLERYAGPRFSGSTEVFVKSNWKPNILENFGGVTSSDLSICPVKYPWWFQRTPDLDKIAAPSNSEYSIEASYAQEIRQHMHQVVGTSNLRNKALKSLISILLNVRDCPTRYLYFKVKYAVTNVASPLYLRQAFRYLLYICGSDPGSRLLDTEHPTLLHMIDRLGLAFLEITRVPITKTNYRYARKHPESLSTHQLKILAYNPNNSFEGWCGHWWRDYFEARYLDYITRRRDMRVFYITYKGVSYKLIDAFEFAWIHRLDRDKLRDLRAKRIKEYEGFRLSTEKEKKKAKDFTKTVKKVNSIFEDFKNKEK